MSSDRMTTSVVRWVAGCGLGAMVLFGGAARRFEGPRIAVVDTSRLVSTHRESREEQQLIKQWFETSKQLLNERVKAYQADVAGLEELKAGSEELKKRSKELRVRKFELESEQQAIEEEYEQRIARSIADAHVRIAAACKTWMQTHDLDAVLQHVSNPVVAGKDVVGDILNRTVVSFRDTLDATDGVLAILDAGK